MSLRRNPCLLLLVRLFLGGMFIYAALPKILDPYGFAVDIHNYKLFPAFAVGLLAAGLPWMEMTAGIMLVIGIRHRAAALIITGMLAAFTLLIFITALRGIDADCGCFSTDRAVGYVAVVEDGLFTLLGIWYLRCAEGFWCLENIVRKKEIGKKSE